jgi:pimeloyl-ACP methyl ester carboxylesterase
VDALLKGRIAMKVLRFLATLALVLAGMALLWAPAHAQMKEAARAFTPTRFTVVDEGTAGKPDVVLIPGLSSSREVWKAEAAKLAPNYRLHLVQINGFAGQAAGANAGATDVIPAVVAELDQYIATRHMQPVVVGHSMGGLAALLLAEQHPADVRKLVIVDTLPFYATMFAPDATVEGAKPIAAQMKQQLASVSDEEYASMQPAIAAHMSRDAQGQKLIAASSTASDRGVVAEAMSEDLTTDARPGLAQMKTPTLVLFEHDSTLTQPNADAYEKTMRAGWSAAPNVTLVKVDDSRHFIMLDQPEKFDAELEGFLK